MKKNEVFKFTALGVKITAVVVDVLEPITEQTFDEVTVITKHLCYAQNRLFYYNEVEETKKVIDEGWYDPTEDYYYAIQFHSHEVKSSGGYLERIVVEYCILPEYDTVLELAGANFDEEASILFS